MTEPGRVPAPGAPTGPVPDAAAAPATGATAPGTNRDADGPVSRSGAVRADAVAGTDAAARAPRADAGRAGAVAGEVVVRPLKALIAAWVGAVAVMVLFCVVAVLLRGTDTGVNFRFADQVALVLLGVLIAGGVLLLARPRVRADAEGIEVRNVLVTRRLPWDVVRRVAFPDGASWARLDLPDDEYLPVLAVQAVDGYRAVDGIARLRALHSAARAS